MPRGKVVYIGTTDTVYPKEEDVNFPFANMEDANYILKAANFMFPESNLTIEDIESTWAGLRPLIYEEGKDPSEVSRKDEIFITDSKLISIAGGKLTGYRKMAERAVDEAFDQLKHIDGRKHIKCTTKKVKLAGGDLKGSSGVADYIKYLKAQYVDFTHESIEDLVYKYGTNTDEILDAARLIDGEDNLLKAELNYGIENESVISISDFLIRRTGRLFFERPTLANKYHQIHQYICDKCGHSKEVSDKQLALFEKEYFGVVAFKS
ncbi:MAG: glycerol-3-phosphate dehydrogenase C-terminal domain-containing protein [Chitinophagales bacterium]